MTFLIHQIHHEVLGATEQAGKPKRPLVRAAHDEDSIPNFLSEEARGLQPDWQPSVTPRIGKPQLVHVAQIVQNQLGFIDNGGVVIPVDYLRSACLGQSRVIKIDHAPVITVFGLAGHLRFNH